MTNGTNESHSELVNSSTSASISPVDNTNITRRSLLSWLGNAAVVALTADFLTACTGNNSRLGSGTTARIPEGTTLGAFDFPFNPSTTEEPIYKQWWGNTVDYQDVDQIRATWNLQVGGMVENPMTLSFADILAFPRQDQVTDFHCVEGWSVFDVPWNGFHLKKLIERVRPKSEATHITLKCVRDIYSESIPLSVALEPRTLFAYGIGGATLPLTHGFPLRLVIPRMYGYKNAKWIKGIEFTNTAVTGYWEQRGYSSDAKVRASRLREGKY